MPTARYIGANGAWNNPANWDTGAVPGNGDTAIIPRTASGDIVSGLSQSAVTLAMLHIAESCASQVGAIGNPLHIGATVVQHRGDRPLWLKKANASSGTELYLAAGRSDVRMEHSGAAFSRVYVLRGTYMAAALSSTTGRLFVCSLASNNDAYVVLDASAVTQVLQNSGYIETNANAVSLRSQTYGRLKLNAGSSVTELRINEGGVVDSLQDGTIANVVCSGGVLDLTGNRRQRTIFLSRVLPGAKLTYDPAVTTRTREIIVEDKIGLGPVP